MVLPYRRFTSSSYTQGRFRSLHRPLGQLVEFLSIYCWMNTIISLVSSSFSNEQDDQWKQFTYECGYLIGPHTITLCIDFWQQNQSFSSWLFQGVDVASGITPGYPRMDSYSGLTIKLMWKRNNTLIFGSNFFQCCKYYTCTLSFIVLWLKLNNTCFFFTPN